MKPEYLAELAEEIKVQHWHHYPTGSTLLFAGINVLNFLIDNIDKAAGAGLLILQAGFIGWKWRRDYLREKRTKQQENGRT